MAGGQERVLRRRIKSVQSTKKITRAMELIAATRVAKAQQRANEARPYSELLTEVIQHLAENGGVTDHPLLKPAEEVTKVGFVVISSDRGLAGGYNSSVIRAAEREIQARIQDGVGYSLITVGRKAQGYFSYRDYDIARSFEGISDSPTYTDAVAVGEVVTDLYSSGEVQEVVLVYTRFVSMGVQAVTVRKFMPLSGVGAEASGRHHSAYEFEPAPGPILESLLPRYVTARLFAALLDSAASEHASRQRAMKAATDNAEELIIKLTRVMNRARQDSITNEIMEIVGGAEALRAASGGDNENLIADHLWSSDPFARVDAPFVHPPREHHFETTKAGGAVATAEPVAPVGLKSEPAAPVGGGLTAPSAEKLDALAAANADDVSSAEDDAPAPQGIAGAPTAAARAAEWPDSHLPIDEDGKDAPAGYPIKGNADSMKYHVPGSRWFDITEAEVWFTTPEAAQAAGFVPAGGAAAQKYEGGS